MSFDALLCTILKTTVSFHLDKRELAAREKNEMDGAIDTNISLAPTIKEQTKTLVQSTRAV